MARNPHPKHINTNVNLVFLTLLPFVGSGRFTTHFELIYKFTVSFSVCLALEAILFSDFSVVVWETLI